MTTSEDFKDVVSQYKPVSDVDEVMARASRRFEETLASTPAVTPRGQRLWKPATLTVLAAAAVVAVAAGAVVWSLPGVNVRSDQASDKTSLPSPSDPAPVASPSEESKSPASSPSTTNTTGNTPLAVPRGALPLSGAEFKTFSQPVDMAAPSSLRGATENEWALTTGQAISVDLLADRGIPQSASAVMVRFKTVGGQDIPKVQFSTADDPYEGRSPDVSFWQMTHAADQPDTWQGLVPVTDDGLANLWVDKDTMVTAQLLGYQTSKEVSVVDAQVIGPATLLVGTADGSAFCHITPNGEVDCFNRFAPAVTPPSTECDPQLYGRVARLGSAAKGSKLSCEQSWYAESDPMVVVKDHSTVYGPDGLVCNFTENVVTCGKKGTSSAFELSPNGFRTT